MGPLIGISVCLDARGRWKPGRDYHYLDSGYASAVQAAGGMPLYVPIQASCEVEPLGIDGLLIPGGDDFSPPHPYPKGVQFDPVEPAQLAFDRGLLESALRCNLPVLGICYGMQLLATVHAGRLHYDLATDVADAQPHQLPEADGRHDIRLVNGSRLAAALGDAPPPVNSLHHQGVAEPGDGLLVCARSPDGVVEAIERDSHRFCIGVQWHPEKLDGVHRDALFGSFVAACRRG
jgi:putative glutamine amidotransferase